MNIKTAFRKRIKQYINGDDVKSAYDINNGLCEEMASDIVEDVDGNIDDTFELYGENFDVDNDECTKKLYGERWDLEQIKKYNSLPLFDKKHLLAITLPCHIWVYHKGKHYDAEAPDGVKSFWDLPIYKKVIKRNKMLKLCTC